MTNELGRHHSATLRDAKGLKESPMTAAFWEVRGLL